MEQESCVMFITRPELWEELSEKGEWPLSSRYYTKIKNLKKGDELLVYVTQKSGVVGIIEVTESAKQYNKNKLYEGDYYHYYIGFKTNVKLSKEIKIRDIKDKLEKTQGKSNWGASFQKAVLALNEHDFKYLYSLTMKKNQEDS